MVGMDNDELILASGLLAAIVAWLVRELSFAQWRRHQKQINSIIVGDKPTRAQSRCLLNYIPQCALYVPEKPKSNDPPESGGPFKL